MGIRTTNVGGTKVHKGFENEYKEAKKLNSDINALRDQIARDPDLSPQQRKTLLAQIDKADNASDRAIDHTTTTKRMGGKDDKFDKNDRVIDNNIDYAERAYYDALGSYTDAKAASKVDKPTCPPAPTINASDLLKMTPEELVELQQTDMSKFADLVSALPDSQAAALGKTIQTYMEAAKTDAPASSSATSSSANTESTSSTSSTASTSTSEAGEGAGKTNALTTMSPQELLALQKSDPEKFFKMMGELPPEQASALNQRTQDHLQTMNRVFSMISNIAQALHQTQKAIIGNIRV